MSQQQPTNGELARQRLELPETSGEQASSPTPPNQSMTTSAPDAANAGLPGRPDFLHDIIDFHEKFGIDYGGKPRVLPFDLADFRSKFNEEELKEWRQHAGAALIDLTDTPSMISYRLEEMLDAHVDQMYVLLGTVYLQGLMPVFEEAWRRVHAANMAKVRAQADGSDSKRGSAYDVVKPEGWTAPDHSDLVADHAHR